MNSVLSISFNTPDCLIVTIGTVCENQDTSVGQWNQRTTLEDEQEIDDDALNGRAYFRFSFGLEDGEWMNERLKQLVELRNVVVN